MSEESNNTKSSKKVLWCLVCFILIISLAIVIWFLFKPKSVYLQPEDQSSRITSIDCSIKNHSDAFFDSSQASDINHEVKETFKDNKVENISYIFSGTYDSVETAENMSANLHTQYNTYMGEHGYSQESLNPTFSTVNNSLKITLFADKTKINNDTAILFFLTPNEYQKFNTRSFENTKKLYENKGFSCQVYE